MTSLPPLLADNAGIESALDDILTGAPIPPMPPLAGFSVPKVTPEMMADPNRSPWL